MPWSGIALALLSSSGSAWLKARRRNATGPRVSPRACEGGGLSPPSWSQGRQSGSSEPPGVCPDLLAVAPHHLVWRAARCDGCSRLCQGEHLLGQHELVL